MDPEIVRSLVSKFSAKTRNSSGLTRSVSSTSIDGHDLGGSRKFKKGISQKTIVDSRLNNILADLSLDHRRSLNLILARSHLVPSDVSGTVLAGCVTQPDAPLVKGPSPFGDLADELGPDVTSFGS